MKRLIRPSLTLRGVTPTLVAYKYWHTNYKGVCVCVRACVCACVDHRHQKSQNVARKKDLFVDK